MKKLFLGGPGSCNVHFEKNMIEEFITSVNTDYEITKDYKDADIIVIIDTCIGTYISLSKTIDYIEEVINSKKKDAQVIVSGCLTKGVKFELTPKQKNILEQVTSISSNEVIERVCRIIKPKFEETFEYESWLESFKIPYEWSPNSISFSIAEGCTNNCSFCKSNYMNFSLKSIPYEVLEKMATDIDEIGYPYNHMSLFSSNISLYGLDLYKKQRSHEAIKLLTSPDCIKFVNVGCLINFYPELIKEIIENPKIKMIYISLESGSERIYNLMNRPISLEKLVEIIKLIKKYRSDIIINTELICGFPTETVDDLKKSAELVQELDINPIFSHAYIVSPQIPSSKLQQHSIEYNLESKKYITDKLQPLQNKFDNMITNGEMLVLEKNENKKVYTVLLINGETMSVRYDQFEKSYNLNDLIPANTVTPKQIAKRRILQK